MPLDRGFFVPEPRFGIVFCDTFPVGIEQAELVLRAGLALLGQRLPFTKGCGVVPTLIGLLSCFEVRPCRGCEQHDCQNQGEKDSRCDDSVITHTHHAWPDVT